MAGRQRVNNVAFSKWHSDKHRRATAAPFNTANFTDTRTRKLNSEMVKTLCFVIGQ